MRAPKWCWGVWDNEGKTIDRYTVAIRFKRNTPSNNCDMLALSDSPAHPQGVSLWSTGSRGKHLGKKIKWQDLPEHVRRHVTARIKD